MVIYFRNPDSYASELQESHITNFSWDYGHVARKQIDILKWAKVMLPNVSDWKMLVVAMEGTAEYSPTSKSIDKPDAVYPSWRFSEGYDQLENYCQAPVGQDLFLVYARDIEDRFRPVRNQPHKVLIYDAPDTKSVIGGNYLRHLLRIKAKYPNVEFILHDTGSFRYMFGSNLGSPIFDPRMSAKMGSVIAGSGKLIKKADLYENRKWIHALGFDLDTVRADIPSRVLFNIESVLWAEQNFNKNVEFSLRATHGIDTDTKQGKYEYAQIRESWLTAGSRRAKLSMGPEDGIICDACSLSKSCKFYREGLVCSVPGTSSADLSKAFGTRDAGVIIDGLLDLTKIQAKRVAMDLQEEEDTGERNIITDKRMKDLFDAGVKVAKLIDPKLVGGGATINLGMIGGTAIIAEQTPQELMASTVRALEAQGVPRADITPDMIKGVLEGVANRTAVKEVVEVEATRLSADSGD